MIASFHLLESIHKRRYKAVCCQEAEHQWQAEHISKAHTKASDVGHHVVLGLKNRQCKCKWAADRWHACYALPKICHVQMSQCHHQQEVIREPFKMKIYSKICRYEPRHLFDPFCAFALHLHPFPLSSSLQKCFEWRNCSRPPLRQLLQRWRSPTAWS